MRGRGFAAYAAAAVIGVVVYALLPEGALASALNVGLGLGADAAVILGTRHHRPLRRAPWLFTAAGFALLVGGDAIYAWYQSVLGRDPFPSLADVSYLAAYPVLAVGFMLLVRGRQPGRDRESLIDSSIFTISLGLLSWVFLVRPTFEADHVSLLERAVGMAYPLADILVMGLLVRLLTTRGSRTASFRLLVASGACLLLADGAFQLSELHGVSLPMWMNALFTCSYLLAGAAAVHPSMRRLSEPAPESTAVFTRRRLVALTVASLVSPGVLAVQLLLTAPLDGWAVVVSSSALFLLVVLRMGALLTRVQEQAGVLAAMARTDGLTGLPNRRTADAELERMRARAVAEGLPLVVGMIDLDRFKSFNDTFGHQAGDKLLQGAAAAWKAALRGSGVVLARYGGEEFQVLSVGPSLLEVQDLLESLRGTTPAGQTFSAGVAVWDGRETLADLVGRADVALYEAKRGGRDRVVAAGEPGLRALV